MPFDAAGFRSTDPQPERRRRGERTVVTLVALAAFLMLITPLSPAGCSALVHHFQDKR